MMRAVVERFALLRWIAIPIALILALSMPVKQVMRNYERLDGSDDYHGYDFAHNILSTVQPEAIVIVQGDNYWAVRGLQILEGMRPDVTVLSEALLNVDWYVEQIMQSDKDLPLEFSDEELEGLQPIPWQDSTIVTLVEGDPEVYRLWEDIKGDVSGESTTEGDFESTEQVGFAALPDTLSIAVPPSIPEGPLFVGHQVLVRMIQRNQWKRPIYFTIPPGWLMDHLRMEGIVWLLVPQEKAVTNVDLLRENLRGRYLIRGYDDLSPPISVYTKGNGQNLQISFYYLASYEAALGDTTACCETVEMMRELLPFDRIEPNPNIEKAIEGLCPP
jgi:hypothetical protein